MSALVTNGVGQLEQWNPERIDLLKRTICKGATNDELELFLSICKRTQLDPFQKQIYAVKRWDSKEKRNVMAAQTSIDGQRLIAERSGMYAGQEGPYWCGQDGVWVDVWLKKEVPSAAKVIVFKKGTERGTSAVAHWAEQAQFKTDGSLQKTWEEMPALMLAKCAESLALRKAFPNELAGLYTVEELPPPTLEKTKPILSIEPLLSEEDLIDIEKRAGVFSKPPVAPSSPLDDTNNAFTKAAGIKDRVRIEFGKFAGMQCHEVARLDLEEYVTSVSEKLKSPAFPEDIRLQAVTTVALIKKYLSEN